MPKLSESEFIGLLYDAAMGRFPWPDVVAAMADMLDGGSAALYASDPVRGDTQIVGLHGVSSDFAELYGTHFLQHDLWAQGAIRQGKLGKAVVGPEIIPDREWERSVIYNELMRTRTGAFHVLGSMLKLTDGRVMAVGSHRPRSMGAFSDDLKARLDRLLPHIQRSAEVWQQLSLAKSSEETLNRMTAGIIQLDSKRCIALANAAAESILRAKDGLSRVGASVNARRSSENAQLHQLISEAVATSAGNGAARSPGGYLRISRPSGKRSYNVLISPLGLDRVVLSSTVPAALMLVTDPEQRSPVDEAGLSELYGLSPTEARIVAGIASGQSLRELSIQLDVTFNTARTLLARAMSKTETNSQNALIRLVLVGP